MEACSDSLFNHLVIPFRFRDVFLSVCTSRLEGKLGLDGLRHWFKGDVGPGSKVLDEQPSQEQDLARVIGHAIPAILCGNQHTVLCDTMPTDIAFLHGVQSVIILIHSDLDGLCVCAFTNLTDWCYGQGISHPDSIPVQDS